MLKRTLTAVIAGAVFIVLCTHGFWWALGAMLLANLLSLIEYFRLLPPLSFSLRGIAIVLHSLLVVSVAMVLSKQSAPGIVLVALFLLTGFYSVLALSRFRSGIEDNAPWLLLRAALLISLPLGMIAAICAWPGGYPFLVLLVGASWGADTGAIWAGKLAGRTPLSRRISPKKTVEGVIGGALAAGLCWMASGLFFGYDIDMLGWPLDDMQPLAAMALLFICGLLLSLAGVVGDLTFSLMKRQSGVKDYGGILPGHGGILDRFDSMLFVAPLLYLLLLAV